MGKNVSGGSGHKAQKNSEGSKARNNRVFVDKLLDDYANGEEINDVFVGKVTRRFGSGRMEVYFMDKNKQSQLMNIPLRGGMRGKGKKSVWVDIDSLVMIAETGLQQTTHEIVAVFTEDQVRRLRKLLPEADNKLFIKTSNVTETAENEGFDFEGEEEEEEEDVDVDNI